MVLLEDGGHTFVREGGRDGTDQTLGSFESWADVIGGILRAADVPGFLGNLDKLQTEANVERREFAAFLHAWHATGLAPMKLADLARECEIGGKFYDAVPTELVGAKNLRQELQYWLRAHKGQRAGGLQLVGHDDGKVNLWSVRGSPASIR